MFAALAAAATVLWLSVVMLPWRPWSTRERLEPAPDSGASLQTITVLVPARNEASCIAGTLTALALQGRFARIVVIDDQSDDGTGTIARDLDIDTLVVIDGTPPPPGWSGKLWALNQGRRLCETEHVLLLDADIGLDPGVAAALLRKLEAGPYDMVSVMATLHMQRFWEKLLLPPFVYFFKLLYPFRLASSPASRVAAGAGGCVLLRTRALDAIGGFESLKGAIIDDCTLARRVKDAGGRIWIGLTRSARALRPYDDLSGIWNMVARTAYTQLRYSPVWLLRVHRAARAVVRRTARGARRGRPDRADARRRRARGDVRDVRADAPLLRPERRLGIDVADCRGPLSRDDVDVGDPVHAG